MRLVQLNRAIYLLLILLVFAPAGMALDQDHYAISTDASFRLLMKDGTVADLPSDQLTLEGDTLQERGQASSSAMQRLLENVPDRSKVIGNSQLEDNLESLSARDAQNLLQLAIYDVSSRNKDRTASTDLWRDQIVTKTENVYRIVANEGLNQRQNELPADPYTYARKLTSMIGAAGEDVAKANSGANYFYEKEMDSKESSLSPINYYKNLNPIDILNYNSESAPERKNVKLNNAALYAQLSEIPNLKQMYDSSQPKTDQILTAYTDVSEITSRASLNINRLVANANEEAGDVRQTPAAALDQMQISNQSFESMKKKNYAVVIGINNYTDRSNLHTSVNDANTMAALLQSFGYNVIELTDTSEEKPTKSNILEKALGEVKSKRDVGKVVIYFSGHGEKKGDDYYLIPQNSNGHISSYISAQELKESIQGLKSVAMVVDACNSGGLENIVSDGQIILTSSKEDQASNEIWFGSLSLFTNNLCNAIKKVEQIRDQVPLQECFRIAKADTERMSRRYLLSQTPDIKDNVDGYFVLK
jgi:hypothetical protein